MPLRSPLLCAVSAALAVACAQQPPASPAPAASAPAPGPAAAPPAPAVTADSPPQPAGPPLDLSQWDVKPVYANDFSAPQKIAREEDFIAQANGAWQRTALPPADAVWIAEGRGGVEIRDGRLRVAPSPFDAAGRPAAVPAAERSHMVVWNHRIFPADLLVEWDMNPGGSTNGLTILLFCATAKDGGDIFALHLPPRRAQYPTYHSGEIANYTDSYWSRNAEPPGEFLTNRLRKNPGFALVAEGPSRTTGPTDVTHRLRLLKVGGRIALEVNGQTVLDYTDAAPLGAGRLGFRSMAGVDVISYGNLKVSSVAPKPATPPPPAPSPPPPVP